jgi:transketolase
MAGLVSALEEASVPEGRPSVVIAHTVKGRGVSFMEGDYRWHSKPIKPDEFATAMRELGEAEE